MNRSRGVYFIANDHTLELAIAFLNSFRAHNADLPLCLIPFDDDFDQVAALARKYDFEIYSDARVLDKCDAISLHFHPKRNGSYRKFAIWEGAFEEFIYIDVDTLVLADVQFAFALLGEFDCLTARSNEPENLKWVWKERIDARGLLLPEQVDFGANTGVVISKKQFLPLDRALDRLSGALALKPYMELHCQEQPLLNYMIVTSGGRYASLGELYRAGRRDVRIEMWAGDEGGVVSGGQIAFPGGAPAFLLHWAGLWQERNHTPLRFLANKVLRLLRVSYPNLRYAMPYKKLWARYRFL